MARVLILGGTAEAAALARALAERGLDVVSSLAGRTGGGADLPGRVRVGGFGGADGLAAYLRAEAITAVVDATHPFAARISAHARAACAAAGVPRLQLRRPAWAPRPGDRWIVVSDPAEAATRLPGLGRRALLTVGASGLEAFARCAGVWFLARLITPPPALPFAGELLVSRGPFRLENELRLLQDRRIDVMVTKASGGPATAAKLEAARMLGLPVLMIGRPPAERGPAAESVDDAVAWVVGRDDMA